MKILNEIFKVSFCIVLILGILSIFTGLLIWIWVGSIGLKVMLTGLATASLSYSIVAVVENEMQLK